MLHGSKGGVIPLSMFDSLGDGVTLTDETGRIVFSNKAADRILGVAPTDGPPEAWSEHYGVFLPDGSKRFPVDQYPLVRALRGEDTSEVVMLIRNANVPAGVLISATGCAMRDATGRIYGASVVFREVSRQRGAVTALRDELEAVRRQLDQGDGSKLLLQRIEAAIRLCQQI